MQEVTKVCTKCNLEKSIIEYSKDSSRKVGIRPSCRDCESLRNKTYRNNNKERIKENRKRWTDANKQKINIWYVNYRKNNKNKIKQWEQNRRAI